MKSSHPFEFPRRALAGSLFPSLALAGLAFPSVQDGRVALAPPGQAGAPQERPDVPHDATLGEVLVLPIDRQDDAPPAPVPALVHTSDEGDVLVQPAGGDPYFLGFAAGPYFPPAGERLDPELARLALAAPTDGRPQDVLYAFAMLERRASPERIAALEAFGARSLGVHPHNCVKLAVPATSVGALAAHPEVRWLGLARPWQKVHPKLAAALPAEQPGALIDVFVDVFDSDLNPLSSSQPVGRVQETGPGGVVLEGDAAALPRAWRSNGWQERALAELGLEVGTWHEPIRAFRARVRAADVERLIALDFVQFVEADLPSIPAHDESTPLINADRMRVSYDGGTNLAVVAGQVDSGLDIAHGGLNGFTAGWDFTPENLGPTQDDYGHGSHVAGTIFGDGTVNPSYTGVAPGLGWGKTGRFFNLKIFNSLGSSAGVDYDAVLQTLHSDYTSLFGDKTPRPHVANHSYGQPGGGFFGTEAAARQLDAEVYTYKQLHVFASGNEGPGSATLRLQPSAKNIFAVGAVIDFESSIDGDPGSLASFSSRGPTGDGRWKPNVVAPGDRILSVDSGTGTGYVKKQGTSMAAPHVTGLAAQLMDHYSFLRYNPSTTAAMLMASAMTKDGQGISSPGSSHLSTYGTGRVEAYKSHGGDSQQALFYWGFNQGSSGYGQLDFPIGAGATRLTVVMTYHEPAASSGASQALVNDLDLWIDPEPFASGGNSGNYFGQQSSKDNTEVRTLNNPQQGNWRLKIFPKAVTSTCQVGVSAVVTYADLTPDGTLTVTASDSYVKPNEAVDITAKVTNPSYIASAVFLDSTSSGATLLGSTTTLYDGAVTDLMTNQHNGRDVLLGDIVHGSSRSAKWTVKWSSEGVKSWQVEARSDNWVDETQAAMVTVDGTPPSGPANLASTTHGVGAVSCSGAIQMSWTPATDALSGLDGYGYVWDHSPATAAPQTKSLAAGSTSLASPLAGSFQPWYLHLAAVDKSGNWGATKHAGPYFVAAAPIVYCTAKVNSKGCTPQIAFSGTPSVSGGAFKVSVSKVLNQKNGLLFWSLDANNAPFQGGFLCVAPPTVRTSAQGTGGNPPPNDCTGSMSFTWTQAYLNSVGLAAGDTAFCQFWYRDPGSPSTTGLSDAVQFTLCQ